MTRDLLIIASALLALAAAVAFRVHLDRKKKAAMPSEFGRGIVIPLVKFSQHLGYGETYHSAITAGWRWLEMTPEEKQQKIQESEEYPRGDAAGFMQSLGVAEIYTEAVSNTPEHAISRMLEMWMYAAADHFYELDDKAPQALKDLASLALRMGRPWGGDIGKVWGKEDYDRIFDLWKEATLQVEAQLGVRDAAWGEW